MSSLNEPPLVLMVDDDADFRAIVRNWLVPEFEHVGLSNGEDLLDEIEALDPDLIILDVRMPGPDGFKLCGLIRADPRFNGVPVLFLTGCKEDADFIRNLDAGGTAYLTKPVDRKRLLSVLRELIGAVSA